MNGFQFLESKLFFRRADRTSRSVTLDDKHKLILDMNGDPLCFVLAFHFIIAICE